MAIDFKVKASGIEVSASGYRDSMDLEVRGVELTDLLSEIEDSALFSEIELDEFIDWADGKGKTSEILDRLDADEVISWLRSNGHLEADDE